MAQPETRAIAAAQTRDTGVAGTATLARSHVSRWILALMCAMSFLLYLDRVNLAAAAGIIRDAIHLSNTQLGVVFGAFAYTYAIFQVVGGWIADRLGAKWTLLFCASIWAVASAATGLAGGFASLFCARMLLGVGEGAALPAQARAMTYWFLPSKRGFVQGLTHSFSRLGNAVTPPLIAFLVAVSSWRAAFFVAALLTTIWAVIFGFYFTDNPRKRRDMTDDELLLVPPQSLVNTEEVREPVPWRRLIRRMAPTMTVYFCYGWTAWLFFTWLPTFFMHGRGLDLKGSALYSGLVFLAGVAGNAAGGIISDRVLKRTGDLVRARRNVIIGAFVSALVFLAPILFSTSEGVIAVSLGLAFFFLELTNGPIWAVPMDITPEHVGIASGLMNAGSAIAGIFSPIVFGMIVDRTGNWTLPFAGSLGLLAVGVVMTFYIRPDASLNRMEA